MFESLKDRMKKYKEKPYSENAIYELDGKITVGKAIPFGIQHVLAMFVANIAPILVMAGACGFDQATTAKILQSAMFIAGVGTLIQLFPLWKIGSGLPIVMGISFTFVSVACVVGAKYGYGGIMGAVLIGGLVEGVLGLLAKYWLKLIAPIVSASVVTAIGFSLLSVGANSFGGGVGSDNFGSTTNWILGTVTLLSCILFQLFAKKYFKQLSVLFGLIVGYLLAIALGVVDFSGLKGMGVTIPGFMPFSMEFHPSAILAFVLIFMVSASETVGDTSAITATGLDRDVETKELSGSIACDGFVSALASLFGCMPVTSYSQNVGLVAMTKVVNRVAIAMGAVVMILAGLFPLFGAVLYTLPEAVLGGCTIMRFGIIVKSGMQMIGKSGYTQRNITIVALSLSIGIGFTQVPDLFKIFPSLVQTVFAENCVAVVFVCAVILNLILPQKME